MFKLQLRIALIGLVLLAAVAGIAPHRADAAPATSPATSYELAELFPLSGSTAMALSINDNGEVAGVSTASNGQSRATLWRLNDFGNYTPQHLGTLGGNSSEAKAINIHRQIAGTSLNAQGQTRSFFWDAGTMTDLGTLAGLTTIANGINDLGQVVGYSFLPDGRSHAFLWQNGVMEVLPPLGTQSAYALGINNQGQITGYSHSVADAIRVVRWQRHSETGDYVAIDLGAIGTGSSFGQAINNHGEIAGHGTNALGRLQALRSIGDSVVGLPGLTLNTSLALGINDAGQIVGASYDINNRQHAALWNGESIVDLEDPEVSNFVAHGWSLGRAWDINNHGVIVGNGSRAGVGVTRAFLLKPTGGPDDTTPPQLSLPDDIVVDATGADGSVVTYQVSATDDMDPAPVIDCEPPSGSTFPSGTTTVDCAATDNAGNTSSGSFTVTVRGATEQLRNLEPLVRSIDLNRGIEQSLTVKLEHALQALESGNAAAACDHLTSFANHVGALSGNKLTMQEANMLISAAERLQTLTGCA